MGVLRKLEEVERRSFCDELNGVVMCMIRSDI